MDLDLISPKAPVCWAVLDALNNNNILGGDGMGEGYPAESSHHITVKGSVHVHVYMRGGCRHTPLYNLDGQP